MTPFDELEQYTQAEYEAAGMKGFIAGACVGVLLSLVVFLFMVIWL